MRNFLIIFILFLSAFSVQSRANTNGNELRVVLQPSRISLDPGGVQDSQSWIVSRQVNCQLVRSQGSIYVLDAAESIKYLTPLKIVIKISNKAKFHDGTSVTSEDVVTSFNYIKESRKILSNLFVWINEIQIIDDKTIVLSLKRQIPQFLKVLSTTNYTIFKKDFLEKAKKDKALWKAPVGCGGYRVIEFNDEFIKLTPIAKGLPITFYTSKKNQINADELEKYDLVSINVMGSSSETTNFNVIEMFDPIQIFVGLNSKSEKWKDKRDRCQFLAELDTKNLRASYGVAAVEATDLLPKGTLGYNPDGSFNTQMISHVKREGNHESKIDSKPFCLSYLTVSIPLRHKDVYLNMFRKIYPNIHMKPIEDVKRFGKNFVNEKCDALLFGWKSNYLDGYEYLTIFEDNDANFTGIYNKSISDQILQSQYISDATNRAEAYKKIVNEIGDFCVIRPLFTLTTKKIYVRKNLKTPGIGLISIHQYYLGNITR